MPGCDRGRRAGGPAPHVRRWTGLRRMERSVVPNHLLRARKTRSGGRRRSTCTGRHTRSTSHFFTAVTPPGNLPKLRVDAGRSPSGEEDWRA